MAEHDVVATEPLTTDHASRSRWRWWPLLVLAFAAVVGLVIGAALGLRESSLFPDSARVLARPTIVIATAPTRLPVAASPSPAATAVTDVAVVVAVEREYVVEPGDTLRSIALDLYDNADLWMRLYEANREQIGSNPNSLRSGMRLRVPPAE